MPGRGFAPKPDSEVRRRNTRSAVTVLVPDGELHGPDLPDSIQWPSETREWWRIWRESAQAQTFQATDWSFLLDTATIHALFWNGHYDLAAELRIRVAKFGATMEDRTRLRMAIGEPSADASVTKIRRGDGRRTRLKSLDGNAG